MMLIPCPNCGLRNSNEFAYSGERRARPDPSLVDAARWRTYLYVKNNPAGWTTEGWFHSSGCRKFFIAERHTVTNEIRATYLPGGGPDTAPGSSGQEAGS